MPVLPPGIPPYKIKKPCTMGDKGISSLSITADVQRVLNLIDDERHLTAHSLYTSIIDRIQRYEDNNNKHRNTSNGTPNDPENALNDTGTTTNNGKKQKSKTFSSSFMKRSSSGIPKQPPAEVPNGTQTDEEMMQVKDIIFQSKKHIFDKLENRCQLFRSAQMNFASSNTSSSSNHDTDDSTNEWIYASKHFGVTTYYRREASDQSLSIKLEGTVEGAALFEQICVLKEVDLHYLWSPFCTSSLTIANLDKLDIVGWFLIGLPNFGLARDGCYRAIGCDNIEEDGSIILTGRGLYDHPPYISTTATNTSSNTTMNGSTPPSESNPPSDTFLSTDPILEKLDIPPVPTRMGSGRMTIRKFDAIIHITSPTSVRTQLIANMNPNISFLPNTLLEFGMKHLASVVLSKLQNAAKKATLHPVTNLHAIKMREEKEFYQTWLLEKFKSVCTARGWDMPPVAAFNLTEMQEHKAQRYMKSHKKDIHGYERAQTFPADNPQDDDNGMNSLSHDDVDSNSEVMSALSTDTGRASVWSNNPISSYLRETERKIQQRKAEAEAESRQRAVERLQPRDRSYSDEERLIALKLAKYRRLDLAATTSTKNDAITSAITGVSKSYSQNLAYQLYNHSPRTRYSIVLTLVCVLLLMLHTGVIVETSKVLSSHPTMPWYINRSKDVGAIIYIFICTIPHFLLVNVSLIYAFDALDIGSKSGRQAKSYYSDNVYGASIVASFGIATVSIALAMFKAFIRTCIWLSVQLCGLIGIHIVTPLHVMMNEAIHSLPSDALTISEAVVAVVHRIARTIVWIVSLATGLVWRYVFQSNIVGQGIARCISAGIAAGMNAVREANTFVYFSIKSFDGEVTLTSWRVEAFTTARFLFLNTAVFLLVTLTLFYLTSRKPAATTNTIKESTMRNASAIGVDSDNTVSSAPQIVNRYATIPEERIVDVVDLQAFNPVENTSADGATATTRRRRFRFRNAKVSSSPNMSTTVGKKPSPVNRSRLQHTKTM